MYLKYSPCWKHLMPLEQSKEQVSDDPSGQDRKTAVPGGMTICPWAGDAQQLGTVSLRALILSRCLGFRVRLN